MINTKKINIKKEFYLLQNLSYNILDEVIRLKKWHILSDINIFFLKEFLFIPNVSKISPFLQIFLQADYETISRVLAQVEQANLLNEKIIIQKNAKEQTMIHLLIENPKLSIEDITKILRNLKKHRKNLLSISDNQHFLPISYYILIKYRENFEFSDWLKKNFENINLLLPIDIPFSKKQIFDVYDFFLYLDFYYTINLRNEKKTEFEIFFLKYSKILTIFNNKILQTVFNKNSEELLLHILKKIQYLNLNTFINDYNFGLGKKKHCVEILIKNNWLKALSLLFSKNPHLFYHDYFNTAFFRGISKKIEISKNLMECFHEITDCRNQFFSFSFSILDQIVSGLKMIKNEQFYKEASNFLIKNIEKILNSYNGILRKRILMNITLKNIEKNFHFDGALTLIEIIELDDMQLAHIFEYLFIYNNF